MKYEDPSGHKAILNQDLGGSRSKTFKTKPAAPRPANPTSSKGVTVPHQTQTPAVNTNRGNVVPSSGSLSNDMKQTAQQEKEQIIKQKTKIVESLKEAQSRASSSILSKKQLMQERLSQSTSMLNAEVPDIEGSLYDRVQGSCQSNREPERPYYYDNPFGVEPVESYYTGKESQINLSEIGKAASDILNAIGQSFSSSWEAFKEDPVATLLPIASGAAALGFNFAFFGLAGAASFMGHVVAAGYLGSGGYILYEAANGESERAKSDALRFMISFIPVAGGIQITGSGGTGGNIQSGGALVLSGAGELSFAYSGEITAEQGLAIIEGISGNSRDENSSKSSEETDQDEIQKKVKETVKKVPDEYKKVFKCEEFADSLLKELDEQGIQRLKFKITSRTQYIISDKFGCISENYIHCYVEIGNLIYDNLHLYGISYSEFLSEYGILDFPNMFTITPE